MVVAVGDGHWVGLCGAHGEVPERFVIHFANK